MRVSLPSSGQPAMASHGPFGSEAEELKFKVQTQEPEPFTATEAPSHVQGLTAIGDTTNIEG